MSDLDFSRRQIIESAGTLVVGFAIGGTGFVATAAGAEATVRTVLPESLDSWLAVARDDTVTLFTGRVDLGTGTETVFAQFVADELDVPIGQIRVIMGDTRLTPDQGKTTASLNVVRGSQPIRVAAARGAHGPNETGRRKTRYSGCGSANRKRLRSAKIGFQWGHFLRRPDW